MYFFGFGCILIGTILYCLSEPKSRNLIVDQNSSETDSKKASNQTNEAQKLSTNFELFKV